MRPRVFGQIEPNIIPVFDIVTELLKFVLTFLWYSDVLRAWAAVPVINRGNTEAGESWGGEHLLWALRNIRVLMGGWVSARPPCRGRQHAVRTQCPAPIQETKAEFRCGLGCLQGSAAVHEGAKSPGRLRD